MRHRKLALLVGLIFFGFRLTTTGQGEPPKEPAKPYQWKDAAKKRGFNAKDLELLDKNKIIITSETFRQVFDPYVQSDLPVFITSDSLLNAYHVLYEESILRLEQANAQRRPQILLAIWKNLGTVDKELKGKPELVAAAKTRAQVIIGTALKLLGDETIKPDEKVGKLIASEVERITTAQGKLKPEWLGPPDEGFLALDYARYKPQGFYTKSPELQRYFRAVSWLQSIPFRVSKDEELLSILMLGSSCGASGPKHAKEEDDSKLLEELEEQGKAFRFFAEFIGPVDDCDLLAASAVAPSVWSDVEKGDVAKARKRLLEEAKEPEKRPAINDQLAFPPDDPTKIAFRIISPYRTPDGVLFQRTTDPRQFERPYPSGLELVAALGSAHARSQLDGKDREKLLATIEKCKVFFGTSSLYGRYLDCLSGLLDKAEPDAPAFMSGEAWQIKSCQTALSGWAQLRHTWSLQAKQAVVFLNGDEQPPGFVEPDPEFFARMGRLVERTETVLRGAGAFDSDPRSFAADIRAVVDFLEKEDVVKKGLRNVVLRMRPGDDRRAIIDAAWSEVSADPKDSAKFSSELLDKLKKAAAEMEQGRLPASRVWTEALRARDISPIWRWLGWLCHRLESLAHKQLRRVPFTENEEDFLRNYGKYLAGSMFYGGNSYLRPNDDALRITDVFHNPNQGKYLQVGIGRSRALYVLYPAKGGEVLCRGAVMPYYEFSHGERLTDADWKALLDSPNRPDAPSWVKPILGTSETKRPRDD